MKVFEREFHFLGRYKKSDRGWFTVYRHYDGAVIANIEYDDPCDPGGHKSHKYDMLMEIDGAGSVYIPRFAGKNIMRSISATGTMG